MNESNVTENNSVQATNLAHLTRVPVEVVGEPVDLLVNGQFFAKGEVIAIEEETYGIRITHIISEDEKMNRLSEML